MGIFDSSGDFLAGGLGFLNVGLASNTDDYNMMRANDPLDLFGFQAEYAQKQQDDYEKAYNATIVTSDQLAREKFARFSQFGKQIEDNYLNSLFNAEDRENQVGEAKGLVQQQFSNASRAQDQTNARYGQQSADVLDYQKRKAQIEQALSETESANTTRSDIRQRDLEGAYAMSAMARGLSGQVSSGAATSAGLSAARTAQSDANIAATQQTQTQAAGTIGGAVIGALI